MTNYGEDSLVQRNTAEYLEQELGWESVFAYNAETFGPAGTLGRMSDREVVLTRHLRAALEKLNPGLPDTAYEDAMRELVTVSAAQGLLAANRDKYNLILEGILVTITMQGGERKYERLRVLDFDEPDINHFLCVRELYVQGDIYRRRADIVCFVNGLPLIFMELKNLHRDIRCAYDENFSDYKDTIPHLFYHNAFVVLGNDIDAKIGSLSSRFEHFGEWKRLHEDEPGIVNMETLLKGVCAKTSLLDIVENFILFDDSAGETRKILARNHQFLGVNRAVAAVAERKERNGKLGVFWHTQGAGKSYSIVLLARKVRRKLGGNFTFLMLIDREDLDTQLYKTFAGCGVADNDRDPCRASSGNHLKELLGQQKSYIFSLVQKFNQKVPEGEPYTARDDVIVVSDEAHRTQYGLLALNRSNALPNASYIGFTGTPLFTDEEITRRTFGDYISTYDFQRAIDDNATVPLFYDARGDKLEVATDDPNDRLAAKLEELEGQDVDITARLEQELKRDYHIITADKRLEQIAWDFVRHYSNAWENGKAMLVCIDKVTCVRMHQHISDYWDKRIEELRNALLKAGDEQEESYLKRQIAWMQKTRSAVVISEEQGEIDKFRKWKIDIKPYRRLIKEGMVLPEAMRKLPKFHSMQRMPLDEAFKEREHPFRIAIVCAIWLTGFDVPSLQTLYLDKPLKAHTLMQAIARANRIDEGKNNGLIVDYCGILKNLRNALATFAGIGDASRKSKLEETDPAKPADVDLMADLEETMGLVRTFLDDRKAPLANIINASGFGKNAAILAAKEAVNENDESRKLFEIMCCAVFQKFRACLNQKSINAYRNEHDAVNIIYKSLQADRAVADITDIIRVLHEIVDSAIETCPEAIAEPSEQYDISKIDFARLKREFERSRAKKTTVQVLKNVIKQRLQRLMQQNPVRTDFQKHYEEIVAEYNREKNRATIEQTFEALLAFVQSLDNEESRAVREGLTEESLALFDLLKKPTLAARDVEKIKAVAEELLVTLKREKLRVDHWRDKEATCDAVKQTIRDFLWSEDSGLPVDCYTEEDVNTCADAIYRHVYHVYPQLPSPYYPL